jgi:hypothetical protein
MTEDNSQKEKDQNFYCYLGNVLMARCPLILVKHTDVLILPPNSSTLQLSE